MKNNQVMHISVTKELKEKAQKYANEMNISLNSLIRLSLSEYLKDK